MYSPCPPHPPNIARACHPHGLSLSLQSQERASPLLCLTRPRAESAGVEGLSHRPVPLRAPCPRRPLSDTTQEKPGPAYNQNRPKQAFLLSASLRPLTPTIHTQSEDQSYGTGWGDHVPMGRTTRLYSGELRGQPASLLRGVSGDQHPLALSGTTVHERLWVIAGPQRSCKILALFKQIRKVKPRTPAGKAEGR